VGEVVPTQYVATCIYIAPSIPGASRDDALEKCRSAQFVGFRPLNSAVPADSRGIGRQNRSAFIAKVSYEVAQAGEVMIIGSFDRDDPAKAGGYFTNSWSFLNWIVGSPAASRRSHARCPAP